MEDPLPSGDSMSLSSWLATIKQKLYDMFHMSLAALLYKLNG
jgi:hypothetical protein